MKIYSTDGTLLTPTIMGVASQAAARAALPLPDPMEDVVIVRVVTDGGYANVNVPRQRLRRFITNLSKEDVVLRALLLPEPTSLPSGTLYERPVTTDGINHDLLRDIT